MTNLSPSVSPLGPSLGGALQGLKERWGWVLGIGVLLLIMGFVALGTEIAATVASVWFVGVAMAVAGIGEIVHALRMKSWGRSILWLILGVLYTLAGIFFIMQPLQGAVVLTLLLGASLVASGIVRIILAFQMKQGTPWVMVVLSGLITAVLGVVILIQWPLSSLWVLGLFLAIDLIFAGVSWIMMGLALRRA
jgi:uncharacterized membrane protein HdeD (DUF308 family)